MELAAIPLPQPPESWGHRSSYLTWPQIILVRTDALSILTLLVWRESEALSPLSFPPSCLFENVSPSVAQA